MRISRNIIQISLKYHTKYHANIKKYHSNITD